MRRKDREITDLNEMISIIQKCDTCRLAMFDEGYPYMVPMNFGLAIEDDQIYFIFHCAKDGKKLDLLRKDPHVFFEMDCSHRIVLYDEIMSCTMGYESVMGKGIVEFIEDHKYEYLKKLMGHFHEEDFPFDTRLMDVTTVFRVKVIEISGKRRDNTHSQKIYKEITL